MGIFMGYVSLPEGTLFFEDGTILYSVIFLHAFHHDQNMEVSPTQKRDQNQILRKSAPLQIPGEKKRLEVMSFVKYRGI